MEPQSSRAEPEATLCTVLTPAHLELGRLNHWLVQTLNPAVCAGWSVTFSPGQHTSGAAVSDDAADSGALSAAQAAFPDAQIHAGPTLRRVFDDAFSDPAHASTPADERRRLLRKYLASYHHAAGPATALAAVSTRYAIVIDPDFYVFRRGWIRAVLEHMGQHDLAVFGAPWSPRWYQKYRGFPSTHLMVIDLEKVPWTRSLLGPDLVGGGRRFASELWARIAAAPQLPVDLLLRRPLQAIAEDSRQRASIGSARDTGYGLMRALASRPDLKVDLLQAVFAPQDGFMPPAVSRLQHHPLVEAVLPDRLRYLPRNHRAWTRRGFAELGLPSSRERGWEEFLWRGEAFAVHVRGEFQRRPGRSGVDVEQVRASLAALVADLDRAAPLPSGPESADRFL